LILLIHSSAPTALDIQLF